MFGLLLSRRLISLGVFLTLSTAYAKVGSKFAKKVINLTKCTLVSYEITQIDKAIKLFMLTANSPPPNNFSSFLSKQFDSSTGRDLTTDLWKAPYKYDSDRASYEIRSSGPDIQMDSKDDLYLKRKNGKVVASQMGFKESELMDAIKTVEEERKKTIEALEKSQKMADEIIKNQDKEALKKLENALKDFE